MISYLLFSLCDSLAISKPKTENFKYAYYFILKQNQKTPVQLGVCIGSLNL